MSRKVSTDGGPSISMSGANTWRSVDTNVLLQNIDDLETARTYASVDTDMLLADMSTVPTEHRVDTVPSGTRSPSYQRRSVGTLQVPPLRGNGSRDSFDMMTARSVSSVGCEPVVYDTERRHVDDVITADGLSASRNDFAYSADFEAEDSARSDASLDAAIRLRDSPVADSSPPEVGSSMSAQRSARTSRTLASVDTNILLKTTEDVVMAMEVARGRHEQVRLEYDVIEQRQSIPAAAAEARFENVGEAESNFDDEQTELDSTDDRSTQAMTSATDSERREKMESFNGDDIRVSGSRRSKPPAHGRKSTGTVSTRAWMPGSDGSSSVWRSMSDLDINGSDHARQYRHALTKSKSTLSRLTEKTFNLANESDTDCSSDLTSTGRNSALHINGNSRHRVAAAAASRSRSSSRNKSSEHLMDSSRSLASGASLGQKIVARSRDNMKPAIKSQSSDGGRHASTNGKQVSFQRHAKASAGGGSKSTASSSSGLMLEGYRVPVRPASTTFSRPQPFSDNQGMKTWNSVDKTADRHQVSTQHVSDSSSTAVRSAWQRGEHQRTVHNGWVSGTASGNLVPDVNGFKDSLYTNGDEDRPRDVETARDEQCLVSAALVSSISQLSTTVTSQAEQLIAALQRTCKLQVDGYRHVNRPKGRNARSSNTAQDDLLDVLDNLEAAGHHLLAVNKALVTMAATKNGVTHQSH